MVHHLVEMEIIFKDAVLIFVDFYFSMTKEKNNGTIVETSNSDLIEVFGARVHNLKNIDIAIPKK